jgi:hypothetical protein
VPTAGTFTSGSAFFQICPYIDQGPLFNAPTATGAGIAAYMCPGRGRAPVLNSGWPVVDYAINIYLNDPALIGPGAGNQGLSGPSGGLVPFNSPDNKCTLVGIADGTSNTVFFGHAQINIADYSSNLAVANYLDSALHGGGGATGQAASGTSFARDSSATSQSASRGWGGPFSQGCLFCMADATVRMFPYSIGAPSIVTSVGGANLGAFMTPTGGEVVTIPDT